MKQIFINHKIFKAALFLGIASLFVSCQMGKTQAGNDVDAGDTIQLKYAQRLTMVKHGEEYTEVILANPWKEGTLLHRYILVPKGKEGDEIVNRLAKRRSSSARCATDTVRTPVTSSVIFTGPHCQLMYELGCKNAITGVCDMNYINIPDIKKRVMDCGSGMQPDIERIISLKPEALLVSPFENSGGYGKLDKLHIPIIEAADYMETSPLGRAEWMKFYGMLFEKNADSLFTRIEQDYLHLKAVAKKLPQGLSVLTERKTGSVWYVPGGQSTIGILLKDANARYVFEDDSHSGSLAMSPEQVLSKGKHIDVWAFKYFGGAPLTRAQLLQEYDGYKALRCFANAQIYEVDTSTEPYFELTSFHPEILLREFILLSHPADNAKFSKYAKDIRMLGALRFYHRQLQ